MPNRVVETLSLAKVEAKTQASLVFVNFEQLVRRPCSRSARHFCADGFDLVRRRFRRAVVSSSYSCWTAKVQGTITVNGQQFTGAIAALEGESQPTMTSPCLTYIRGNQEWGNSASEATPDQVKAIRAKMAGRSTAWSPDELLKVNENE